jgi:Family of unknown function (DUF5678)
MASTISKPPVPQEAFDRFPGRWVALRDGEIIADAKTEEKLRQDERVESTDALFRVPETSTHFYPVRLA